MKTHVLGLHFNIIMIILHHIYLEFSMIAFSLTTMGNFIMLVPNFWSFHFRLRADAAAI